VNAALAHTVIACLLIVAYMVVTLAGGDGNICLGLLGGQGLGAGAQKLATK
jgi:hypothetical protein